MCIRNNNQFAGLEPEECCFDNINNCTLSYSYDNVEMSDLVGAHPVVVSPRSMVDNHPLCRLGSQQPRRKDHEGFTKTDAHYVQVQISSYCNESLESHRLLELEVTIYGVPITCLINNCSAHNSIDKKAFDKLGLRVTIGKTLEIVLANGSKITVDKVCHIAIQFCKQVRQAVFCYVVKYLFDPWYAVVKKY